MLLKILKHKNKIAIILAVLALFSIIRIYEKSLFYDPFISFYKGNFKEKSLPEVNIVLLFFNFLIRYSINTILSILILKTIFDDNRFNQFSIILFGWSFVLLIIVFWINYTFFGHQMVLFYTRRFIIQPLLLLIFIAGYYYQKHFSSK